MTHTSTSIFALAVAAAAGLATLPAAAQDLQRGDTVLQRPRPEVEQLGVRAGSFVILPRAEVGGTYDSNVLASSSDPEHDFILVARPQLDVRSDFGRHALNFSGAAEIGRYRDFSRLNYEDYQFSVGGRLDVFRDSALTAELTHRREHEAPGDIDYDTTIPTGASEVSTYTVSGAEVGYTQRFNRLRARLTGLASQYDYSDVSLTSGGVNDQGDRNRREYGGTLRVGYEFIDNYEAFVQGGYTRNDYLRGSDFAGRNRDSNEYQVLVGAAADLTGLLTAELSTGYLVKQYGDGQLKDFSGLALEGRLTWTPTELTTVSGLLSRSVRETLSTQGGQIASSYTRSLIALGVDHELLRTLMLNGRLQYRLDDFNGIDRTDDVYTAGVGATYNLNRYVYLTGGYTFEARRSDSGSDYNDNQIFLRIGGQL